MHNHHRPQTGHRPTPAPGQTGYRYGHGGAGWGLYRGHVPIATSAHPTTARRSSSSMSRSATSTGSDTDTAGGSIGLGMLVGGGLIWWAIAHMIDAAHRHHEPVSALVFHTVAGWLG